MSISSELYSNNTHLKIKVKGDFGGDLLRAFHASYTDAELKEFAITNYIIDLTQARYIDSMGLGMLLALEEFAEKRQATVKLKTANKNVEQLFEIANFAEIFELEYVDPI